MRTQEEVGELIELGLSSPIFIESSWRYIDVVNSYICGCALGAGYVGKVGNAARAEKLYKENHQPGKELEFFSQELGINIVEATRIDAMHRSGSSARLIAELLKKKKLLFGL